MDDEALITWRMKGGLALLAAVVVGGLWIWVLRTALLSLRYGDAELGFALSNN